MTTEELIRVQGRVLRIPELEQLQQWIDRHPEWSRNRVVLWLCEGWDWRTPKGVLKSFACRALLLTLERRYGLRLPPLRCERRPRRPFWQGPEVVVLPVGEALAAPLGSVAPLHWVLARHRMFERERAVAYLRAHHYLGLNRPVGSHLIYLVQDRHGRDLAVHVVGAAAWQCAPRDRYLGWDATQRGAHLQQVANHSRFLILPWVRVPGLASHLLAGLRQRLVRDWEPEHGHRLVLLETFVEFPRYAGTAYRADNWLCVGTTRGRTRQDKSHRQVAPLKTVWVRPLCARFRRELGVSGGAEGLR